MKTVQTTGQTREPKPSGMEGAKRVAATKIQTLKETVKVTKSR